MELDISQIDWDRSLQVYLLGSLTFESFLSLQRRLIYDVSGEPNQSALLLCDHPVGISIGREGSREHIRISDDELATREWPIGWAARGGGVLLHLPGQVACYPILSLELLRLTPAGYARMLLDVAVEALRTFKIETRIEPDSTGVWVADRQIVHLGAAVRGGVTAFGLTFNVCPDLDLYRGIWVDGQSSPMTSLQRESPLRARIATLRHRLIELFAERLRARVSIFHSHPVLAKPHHASTARRIHS